MAHDHSIVDSDVHFIINATSRKITPASPIKNKLMQLDHNSERFTFEVPRYIEGHDMSLCDSIQIHYRNAGDGLVNVGMYETSDVAVSNDAVDTVQFSWLISQNATQYEGKLSFVIRFICRNNDVITYSWGTDIYDSITVGPSMNYSDTIVAEYADILEQWRQQLFNSGGDGLSNAAKVALIDCFMHVAWTDSNAITYIQALANAIGTDQSLN